jgi:hypothetical protein
LPLDLPATWIAFLSSNVTQSLEHPPHRAPQQNHRPRKVVAIINPRPRTRKLHIHATNQTTEVITVK